MALNEKQILFCEMYANKDRDKLTHADMAEKLGINVKTIQRWLKMPEVISTINRLCAERLDTMLPSVIANTDMLLNSSSSNDRLKANEQFFKLQEKMTAMQKVNEVSREQALIEKFVGLSFEALREIFPPEELINILLDCVGKFIIKEGYAEVVKVKEIEQFLLQIEN